MIKRLQISLEIYLNLIIIKEGYIEKAFKKFHEFFNCFSKNYLDEIDDSWWNNDDYFYDALAQMSNPAEYFGL